MADFVTHYLMGKQARSFLPSIACQAIEQYPACFYWGCQGPDPLFFRAILKGSPLHELGNRLHREKTSELFYVLASAVNWMGGAAHEMGLAYFFGFLCHYTMDSEIHPYVYYHQDRLCAAHPKWVPSAVHCEIEGQIDFALYTRETSQMVTNFEPDKYFTLSPDAIATIATLLHAVCQKVYHVQVPVLEFRRSIKQMLSWGQLLYSDSRLLYHGLKSVERVVGRGALLTGHMKVEIPTWDCLNLAGASWIEMTKTDEERSETVPELVEMACIRANALIGFYTVRFAEGSIPMRKFEFSFDRGNPNL